MPLKTFKLDIVTPQRRVLSQDVTSIVVPGTNGYLGVWAGHAPMIVEIVIGQIDVVDANGHRLMLASAGGFMEVADNKVRILADAAERAEDIDVFRAEEARKRAEARLREQAADLEQARAETQLRRAMNRLRVAENGTNNIRQV